MKKLYKYEGAVTSFGSVIDHWEGRTQAESESKAKANLMFQYKRNPDHNLTINSKIELPGKLEVID